MADWRSAMENNMAKQQVEFTTMAVELTVVSSAKQPSLHFPLAFQLAASALLKGVSNGHVTGMMNT